MELVTDFVLPTSGWTPDELDRLACLGQERSTAVEAAKILGRHVSSVRRQARELGILLYKSDVSKGTT